MTATRLSPTITAYFERMHDHGRAAVIDLFADDAVVTDDGHTYRGRTEILGWLTGPASEFTTTSTRISEAQRETGADVRILLEGDFPGGRVELRHTFAQRADGLITSLDIAA